MDEQTHDHEPNNQDEARYAPEPIDDDADSGSGKTTRNFPPLDDLAAEADALALELDALAFDVGMRSIDGLPSVDDLIDMDEAEDDAESPDADDATNDDADAMFHKPVEDAPAGTVADDDDVADDEDIVGDDEAYEAGMDSYDYDDSYIYPVDPDAIENVDSALDSLTGLGAIVEEHEKAERRQVDEAERLSDIQGNPMTLPKTLTLNRGRLISILPGVAFIGIGAWLTFAYTTQSAPPAATVGAVVVGLFALMLFTAWIASNRWNRGALFIALWGILTAGLVVVAFNWIGYGGIFPALMGGLGIALLLSGLLARPFSAAVILPGLIFLVAGAVALVVALGLIPAVVMNIAASAWIGVAGVVGIVLLLPVLARLRG